MSTNRKSNSVLITLGPTRAYLDRFRYISNHSTGELGYLICQKLARRGHRVYAVAGPCAQPLETLGGVRVKRVETVSEMHDAVMKLTRKYRPSVAVLAAAVLDFAPRNQREGKVSSKGNWNVELVPTAKIVDALSTKFPLLKKIGFKLEWKPMPLKGATVFARKNMEEKKLEALCLNFLSEIKGKRHPAYLFNSRSVVKATTKSAIADWIVSQIEFVEQ